MIYRTRIGFALIAVVLLAGCALSGLQPETPNQKAYVVLSEWALWTGVAADYCEMDNARPAVVAKIKAVVRRGDKVYREMRLKGRTANRIDDLASSLSLLKGAFDER